MIQSSVGPEAKSNHDNDIAAHQSESLKNSENDGLTKSDINN